MKKVTKMTEGERGESIEDGEVVRNWWINVANWDEPWFHRQ